MRAKIRLGLKRWVENADTDDFGVPTAGFAPEETILAFSVGPLTSTEQGGMVSTGYTIGLPKDYGIQPQDILVVKGKDCQVQGELIDANMGPWSYRPGYVVNVQRVER